jgi:hypothetical protein
MPIMKNNKYNRKYRGRGKSTLTQKDKIIIASDEKEETEYLCPHCSGILGRLNDEEFGCSTCGVSFIPGVQQLRKNVKFTTPDSVEHSKETLVADPRVIRSGNSLADSVKIQHTPQPRGVMARMQEKGLKIVSYSETDGAGRPLNRRYNDEE